MSSNKLKDIWFKCPCCGETVKVTDQFNKIIEELKQEQNPKTNWDDCLIKLKLESPDWDD